MAHVVANRVKLLQRCRSQPHRSARAMSVAASATFKWGNAVNKKREARPQNVQGDFFVDYTCIDCDTCRWMAPSVFHADGGQSAVYKQPEGDEERLQALQAVLSCPTHSIHAGKLAPGELAAAQRSMPIAVPHCPGIYHCGWHDAKSFAAASYLLVRPGGNVLVDSPRYSPVLAQQIEKLGGVKYLFLTHRDDVGDHKQWAQRFRATRILHSLEVNAGTADVELQLQGEGPWRLADLAAGQGGTGQGQDADDVQLIFTPGHTTGHVCLLHEPTKTLFTGDHLSASYEPGSEGLFIFTDFNWYSVPLQLQSVAALLQYDFTTVLPGHGRRRHLRDAAHKLEAVSQLLQSHGYDGQLPAAAGGAS